MHGSDSIIGSMCCWKCGTRLEHAPHSKLSRKDTCHHCHIDLRVCKNCKFHDPSVHNECLEVGTEMVRDREGPNFCDYFVYAEGQRGAESSELDSAKDKLAGLFKL